MNNNNKITFDSIDEYIAVFHPDIQAILQAIRQVIHEAVPEAKEKISYQMPTFELHGNLVHFAAFKNHNGFYPAPSGIEAFQEEVKPYHKSDLISRIVKYRVAANIEKASSKRKK